MFLKSIRSAFQNNCKASLHICQSLKSMRTKDMYSVLILLNALGVLHFLKVGGGGRGGYSVVNKLLPKQF